MKRGAELLAKPWTWSFLAAGLVFSLAVWFAHGTGAGGMITTALALAVFTVVVGLGQMMVITLGPETWTCRCRPIGHGERGLHDGDEWQRRSCGDLASGQHWAAGLAIGIINYLMIRALGIPPIVATLVVQLHRPVRRYRPWAWPADQASSRVRRSGERADCGCSAQRGS